MALSPDQIPVIAGVGEITKRSKDFGPEFEPLSLMAEAARGADTEARGLLSQIDSLDIVGLVSWRYENATAQLCEKLGIRPARAVYGDVGGESPIRFLHEAAQRIAQGTSSVALIVGAEAQYAVNNAKRANAELPWTPYATQAPRFKRAADYVHPLAIKMGVAWPVNVYPFYEVGAAHAWGQTPDEALRETGDIWSAYSQVAARNPYAWLPKALTPDEVTTPTADNRFITWPYTKRMVANPNVNQGAAVIITSLAKARAAGIADDQLVFFGLGAFANERRDWLARTDYTHSAAQQAVLETLAKQHAGNGHTGFDALELYSCFPIVPKLARRTLNLPAPAEPSVTGGLSFFGAPLNNHMTHAACAMVRRIREGAQSGLLYGQGEFVTKHYGLILSRQPSGDDISINARVQEHATPLLGDAYPIDETPDGVAMLETFTVIYDHAGQATHAVILARTPAGARTIARTSQSDEIVILTGMQSFPVDAAGTIRTGADGLPEWRYHG
jgi:acetyl-CoA C-acetyltransferase